MIPSAALAGGSSINGGTAGPSNATSSGDTGGFGQTVGDFYASGSRVRHGIGWQDLAIAAAALVLVIKLKGK